MDSIELVLTRQERVFTARLLRENAPRTCDALARTLEREPIRGLTYHAIYSGHEFYIYCPPEPLPLENHVVWPKPGQLLYYHFPENKYAGMHVHKERIGDVEAAEIAVWYGPGDLRIVTEAGIRGNLFAEIVPEQLDEFYEAGNTILHGGQEELVIRAAA